MRGADESRAVTCLEELSDDRLVELCLDRGAADDRPFAELFRRHRQRVWAICRKYFRSPEDVGDRVQDTFFRAYRALGRYSGGHPALFRAWITTIAANVCKNELRRRSRRPQIADQPLEPAMAVAEDDVEGALLDEARRELLRRALDRLADRHRQILEKTDLEPLPYARIAAELGLSLSAVKMRTLRARAALAAAYRELEAEGDENDARDRDAVAR